MVCRPKWQSGRTGQCFNRQLSDIAAIFREGLTPLATIYRQTPQSLADGRRMTDDKLASPVELEVFDAPLKDVLEHLAQSSRVNIRIDTHPDVQPVEDLPITLKLQKASLAGALEALEDITHHRFVIRNYGILLVGDFSVEERGLVPVIKYATEHLGIDLGAEEETLRKAAEAKAEEKK